MSSVSVAAAAIIAAAGIAPLAAACGGSPASDVAQFGATTTQPLAFSHCMRSNGVANFPDPNSSGVWPKSQVELAAGDSRFQAATNACGHLLPNGGPGISPSPGMVQQIQIDMARFARCMRSRGVPNWPDPTLDRGRAIFDPEAAGVHTNSPQINTKMHECERVFPASVGVPPGA